MNNQFENYKADPELNEDLELWFDFIEKNRRKIALLFHGFPLLSKDEMMSEWSCWRDFDNDDSLNDPKRFSSFPQGAIKLRYTDPKWIPITYDSSGNCIGVDLDPGENGKKGQVINFGKDEHEKYVFADSLVDFIRLLNDNYTLLKGTGHLIDGIRDRIILKK